MKALWLKIVGGAVFSMALSGCIIGDSISIPRKIEGKPNTFAPDLRHFKDRIEKIEVWEIGDSYGQHTLVWEIQATHNVSALGFTVTVGKVPQGFKQILPQFPERFCPLVGQKYSIVIVAQPTWSHPGGKTWTAEPSNVE